MTILIRETLALPVLVTVLVACTTSNTQYPQPMSRGGGWENFRADAAPGETVQAVVTISGIRICVAA